MKYSEMAREQKKQTNERMNDSIYNDLSINIDQTVCIQRGGCLNDYLEHLCTGLLRS